MEARALATDPMVSRVRGLLAARVGAAPSAAPRPSRLLVTDAHEGPVFAADEHALYFTTTRPDVVVRRFSLGSRRLTTLASTHAANGMALLPDGRLVVCEQGSMRAPARLAALDRRTGAWETLCDHVDGRPLNSPNDVVVAPDGALWFTDPSYGHLQGFRPPPARGDEVHRWDPVTRTAAVVATGFDKPNGIALSPDAGELYVTDSGAPEHVVAIDVATGARRVLHRSRGAGAPDGLKVDAEGNVYISAAAGVVVVDPAGRARTRIPVPGAVNFCFGGRDRRTLFVTTDTAVWAAVGLARGA